MPSRRPLKIIETIVGTLEDVQRPAKVPRGTRTTSLLIRVDTDDGPHFEWMATTKALGARIVPLLAVDGVLIGHRFEFKIDSAGSVAEFRRVDPTPLRPG